MAIEYHNSQSLLNLPSFQLLSGPAIAHHLNLSPINTKMSQHFVNLDSHTMSQIHRAPCSPTSLSYFRMLGPSENCMTQGLLSKKTFCKLPTSGDHLLSRRPQGWPCDGAKGQVLNHTGTFPIKVFIGSKAVTNKFGIIHDIQEEAILRLELVCQNDINYYPVQHNLTWVVLALWNFGTAQAL